MKLTINIPKDYNALSDKQLGQVALIFHNYQAKAKGMKKLQVLLLNQQMYFELLRVVMAPLNPIKLWLAMRKVKVTDFVPHLQFLYGDVSRTHFTRPIKAGRVTLYPPYDHLKNATMAEFNWADALYYRWRETGDTKYLNNLVATLYRPLGDAKNINDIRQPFSKMAVDRHLPMVMKLPLQLKLAVALVYEGCRNAKVKQYRNVFPPAYTGEGANPKKQAYTPFGELISRKIDFDPSRLREVEAMYVDAFLGVYDNELRELKKQRK